MTMTTTTPFTDAYDRAFLRETMMGPNAMRITEELASSLPLRPGMRVLDLGCGKGISSILLTQKFDVTVFAADLWISPTENALRFAALGLDDRIFPCASMPRRRFRSHTITSTPSSAWMRISTLAATTPCCLSCCPT